MLGNMIFLLGSCGEFFDTPEAMKGDAWGLRSIEYKQPILFEESSTEIEISYIARVSSKRYELRLYFPSNNAFRNDSIFNIQGNALLTAFEGLEAQIIDESSNKILENIIIKSKKDMSYNRTPEAPLSMWLFSSLSLKKGKNYKIKMKIPPIRMFKKEYYDVILILGIGSTPML